jgi:CBS domain-containing protein
MMKVEDLLRAKGTAVVTVRPHETIDALVHRFKLEKIGAVVVSSDGKAIEGMISERDVVRGLAEHGTALLTRHVSDEMTRQVVTCRPDDGLKNVMRKMTQHRVRHLPVTESGELAGIISIGDVVKNRLDDMEMEANVLRDYIIARQ